MPLGAEETGVGSRTSSSLSTCATLLLFAQGLLLSSFFCTIADAQHDHGHEEERYTGHPKVSQWELCAAPWQTRGGFVNTTDGGEAVSETELGIVVRRLYPCPYTEESDQMGLWVQTCNQDIYAYGHMAPEETLATTCQNNLVVYGLYTTRSSVAKYVVSTLQFETLATVAYGEGGDEHHDHGHRRRLNGDDHDHGAEGERMAPTMIEYSNLRMMSGTGRFTKPYKVLRDVEVESEITADHGNHLDCEAKITVFYKTIGYHYSYF